MGDGLEEAPEERLREGSSVSLPTPAPSLQADVFALDTVDEDGLQGTAEEVSITIFTGDHCVWRYISLLQGLERLCQLLFDLRDNVTMSGRWEILSASSLFSLESGKLRCGSVVLKQVGRLTITSLFTNSHKRRIFMCCKEYSHHIFCIPLYGATRNLQSEFSGHVVMKHGL